MAQRLRGTEAQSFKKDFSHKPKLFNRSSCIYYKIDFYSFSFVPRSLLLPSLSPDTTYFVGELLDNRKIHLARLGNNSVVGSSRDNLKFF